MVTLTSDRVQPHRLLDEQVSVSEAIVRVLREAGIDMVFGIPGGNMVPSLFDTLYHHTNEVRTVLVREESLAGVMAEVYGRLTRRPGVVISQGLWLLANAAMGALEAHLSSSPMLLLGDMTEVGSFSHHAPYQSGSGDYGSWDARRSFEGFTKLTMVPFSGVQAVQETQLAIKHAVTGEPGPVAVLYHSNALFAEVGPESEPRLYSTSAYLPNARMAADAADVSAVAHDLARAKRPVIIAGNGVRISQAYGELRQFAEVLGAPVTTTAAGKSVFPETHELALGVFGTFGQPVANAVLGEADVVLIVGSKLGPTDTANENPSLIDADRQTLIQIDLEPKNAAWTYPVQQVLLGDAGEVLTQLINAIDVEGLTDSIDRNEHLTSVRAKKNECGFFDETEGASDVSPILPQRIIRELQRAVNEDAIICCDAGENRIFMTHYFQTKGPGTFIQSAGIGGMGYAIPAALGAKLVHPARQVVAVCGDGGFAMTMNGLMTAREEHIPIVTVVFNNAALGWVKHEQSEREREIACDFLDYDHAAIARSMGCKGIRVEEPDQLAMALKEALAAAEPTVIDVRTSLSESYRRVTSPLATPVV
jgi:acetolactate synthase I/II/III large subunit